MKTLVNDIEPTPEPEPAPVEVIEEPTPEPPVKKDNTAINLAIIGLCVLLAVYLISNFLNRDK